jgi:hypothetical protein
MEALKRSIDEKRKRANRAQVSSKSTSHDGVAFTVDTKSCCAPSAKPSWAIEVECAIGESKVTEDKEVRF